MRSLLSALLMAALTTAGLAQSSGPGTLRIGLWTLWHDKGVIVGPAHDGIATMRTCVAPDRCTTVALDKQAQIHATANRLALESGRDAGSVELTGSFTLTAHGESLTVHSPVRISARNGELIFAVTLPVESYVERVVGSESGAADSVESLKALAIVVRSFALHQHHGHGDYELCDSTHCQMVHWGSGSDRHPAAHAATLATAGETLWYHGQRAQAWFHQSCGGRTASPSEVWPSTAPSNASSHGQIPWLASRADPYCTASGAREWSANISLSDLTAALAAAGLVRPGWKTLTVAHRGESGRALTLMAGTHEVSAEDFRLAVGRALGWNRILSNWYEVSAAGDQFLFHGRGSGHGVGLCQAGSAAMSALGRDSNQILAQYFPGAIAADEATGQPWQTFRSQGFAIQTLTPADTTYLPQLGHALNEAETVSGLQPAAPITVRAFRSTPAFRNATLAPGWVAAFTEGSLIATQPLSTLSARKLLVPILRHEFLHALIEAQAADSTPLWLREGLVEAWSDAPRNSIGEPQHSNSSPTLKLDQTDRALAHAANEAQSQAAHRAAAWYAKQLLDRYGRAQVLGWLHSALPPNILASIN
jgi:stage II sporulation protein D